MKIKAKKKELMALLCAALLLTGTLFLFGPVNLFLGNQVDFSFSIFDCIPYVALIGLAVLALLMGIGCLLPKKALYIFTAIVFALGLGVYLQGNFLNMNYGELDGRGVQWDTLVTQGIVNTAIWAGILAIAVILSLIKREWLRLGATAGGAFLTVVQLLTMVITLVTTPLTYQAEGFIVTDDDAMTLSSNQNTVIFLIDACDTGYIQQILEEHPEELSEMEGFTYYTDFTGSYSKTKMSLPYILTGKWYENKQTMR